MNFFIIIVFITISLLTMYYFMMKYIQKQRSELFLTREELLKFLLNDSDNFYSKLKPVDLSVRNVEDVDEYKKLLYNAADEFTIDEMRKLKIAMEECDHYLQRINKPGFNGFKCKNIPWKIGCIVGKEYEAGLPHTRGEVIIFPRYKLEQNERMYTRTLIHERIHIYQKRYPDHIQQYLKHNGYTRYKPINRSKTRANPDIDEWTYTDKEGNVMSAEYKKDAKSLRDVTFSPKNTSEYEHPLEKMAIDLSRGY
jgi:hypothetical protein